MFVVCLAAMQAHLSFLEATSRAPVYSVCAGLFERQGTTFHLSHRGLSGDRVGVGVGMWDGWVDVGGSEWAWVDEWVGGCRLVGVVWWVGACW